MLIPLRHENMEGRRWPVVTFTLIALNVLVFLATHWKIEEQEPARFEVRMHLLMLAALHPELKMPEDVEKFVTEVKNSTSGPLWERLASSKRRPEYAPEQAEDAEEGEDAQVKEADETAQLQAEMDALAARFTEVQKTSILENYAFVAAHPKPISFLTSMFLHIGWLHLIGNMWFLWLAGFILEDRWGRVIYPVFYVLAGIAASVVHSMFHPHSLGASLGASGAVAALMGGFLVRFPKLKIEMLWYLFIFRIRFKAPAYGLLPLWLLMEIFYGTLFGQASGVAHWAHVGGFVFGALGALLISRMGFEHQANAVIEEKIGWTADPAVVQGTECLEQGKFDEGIAVLQKHIAAKPDAIDAHSLLRQLYWRKNNVAAYLESTIKLCQLHLKAHEQDHALQDYQEYTNAGGDRMPVATWLELCRIFEGQQNYDRAITEYARLAETYATERQSVLALLSAGRLSLKQLNRPTDALRFYQTAAKSPVPHLDWESNIQAGIQAAEKAAGFSVTPA